MEGYVLSFLKTEWKVSDTGSAHWASVLVYWCNHLWMALHFDHLDCKRNWFIVDNIIYFLYTQKTIIQYIPWVFHAYFIIMLVVLWVVSFGDVVEESVRSCLHVLNFDIYYSTIQCSEKEITFCWFQQTVKL
jgi:hypothetical protein